MEYEYVNNFCQIRSVRNYFDAKKLAENCINEKIANYGISTTCYCHYYGVSFPSPSTLTTDTVKK